MPKATELFKVSAFSGRKRVLNIGQKLRSSEEPISNETIAMILCLPATWPLAGLIALLLLLVSSGTAADTLVAEIEKASNASLLWGPYRPNLYFGVRPRVANSLLTGLMWAKVEDFQSVQHNFRHTCEQHEGMAGYGWERYDPRHGGVQTIHDAGNQIDITTSFTKAPSGQWGVRISGTPREDRGDDLKTTVIFYAAVEAQGLSRLEIQDLDEDQKGKGFASEKDIVIEGENPNLEEFRIVITGDHGVGEENKHPIHGHASADDPPLDRTIVRSLSVPDEVLWQTKPVLFAAMKEKVDAYLEKYGQDNLPPPFQLYTLHHDAGLGNLQLVQKVFEGSFSFDVLFSPKSATKAFTSADLTDGLKSATDSFEKHFKDVFEPKAPFAKKEYFRFSESLLSNLLGGIGYFYGDWKVDRSYAPEYDEENEGFWEETAEARARTVPATEGPSELFTSIPSRPFFPRGFLWDEGFHLLPILDWDVDLTLQIVKSWFNLIDEDGWIAREQILGPEARSKVPAEFQVQYPHYANPPTLFLILSQLTDELEKGTSSIPSDPDGIYYPQLRNADSARAYLAELYPLLKRHYYWFRKTQQGDLKTYEREAFSSREGYRWRGRTLTHLLTSGLDDYPRAQPPHPGELHVDAISWVGLMARSLNRIAEYLGEADDTKEFSKHIEAITRNTADLHWDEKIGAFCDATVDEFEETVHVCRKGYISLFPFMVGLLDPTKDSGKISKLLDLISSPEELWSPHGIRSLSKSDEAYGTGENYWCSPIWINMNYLIVSQLLELAQKSNPNQQRARTLYTDLRKNLVNTVYNSWKETGFAWEQYNPDTGAGQRTQHFTGWTSLVVKILAMPDLSGGKAGTRDEL